MADPALTRLAWTLRDEGGLLGSAVRDPAPGAVAPHGAAAAAGPRGARAPEDYALLVEAIREGHLLHYGDARVLATADEDLALLAGDRLYALGLDVLSRLGDLEAVRVLADTIAAAARAHAEGRPQEAESAWQAGARAAGGA